MRTTETWFSTAVLELEQWFCAKTGEIFFISEFPSKEKADDYRRV